MNSSGAVDYLAEDWLEFMAGFVLVLVCNLAHEAFGLVMSDEVDGRAAEAAAGEASAEAAGMAASEFDEQIEFSGAVFKKVARAFVALEHVLAELAMIIISQSAFSRSDARDFADDVPCAFVFALS